MHALLLALVLGAPQATPPLAATDDGRGWRWSELVLDLWIEPDLGSLHLEGQGRLVLAAERSAGPELVLNGALLELELVEAPGSTVELATRSEGDLRLATARLRCAEPKQRGAEVRVEFRCQSKAGSSQFAVTPKAALASWTQAWYPLPLGDEAELSELMAAAGVTRFHLPRGWQSVSNGEPLAPPAEDEGLVLEAWRVLQPVARSFACAPYTSQSLDVDGRAVGIHRLESADQPADVELRAIAEILRALERRYGPYPYPGYRVAEVPWGVGEFLGSSEQGFIMVRPVAFDAPDGNLALFAHELAHGWWGNRVSGAGPGSILLSEALAQYSAVVAIEALEGEAGATGFLRFSRPGYVDEQCARGYFGLVRAGRDRPLATLDGSGDTHLLGDCKGHWVYHMLAQTMGEERFFATLRDVIRDFGTRPLTLPELRARFERAAPEVDLARFFAQWLDRTGAPILEHEWSADGERALVHIRQSQPGESYHLTLEIAVESATSRRVHTVELTQREATFALPGDAPPSGVELDPRHRLLIWTSDYGPKPAQ